MALDATKTRAAVTGEVSYGLTSATAPTSSSSALTGFTGVGYLNEDGVEVIPERSTDDKRAWQNAAIVRTVTTDSKLTFRFTMIETKKETIELYWGTTVTTSVSEGTYDLDPSSTGGRRAFVIDVIDGAELQRYWIPSGELDSRESISNQNGELIGYAVTIVAYPSASIGNKPARVFATALKS